MTVLYFAPWKRPASQQFVEGAAQRVDVGTDVDRMAVGRLLGGHVVGCAHRLPLAGEFLAAVLRRAEQGEAQVEDFHPPLGREHQVRRLDVAMHQSVLVRVLQSHGGLPDHLAGVGNRQGPALDHGRKVLAFHVFHDEEVHAVDLTGVVGADDIRVVELPNRLHLSLEAGYRPLIGNFLLGQDLDRHNPLELGMPSLVDGPHPP